MILQRKYSFAKLLAIITAPVAILAYESGPPPGYTGAPGDDPQACTSCHTGTALNAGGGSVQIVMPGGNSYAPGVKQHLMVKIFDSAQRRWGFQLTARLESDPANGQAGDFSSTDDLTQVLCDDGGLKPCASPTTVQFIEHTIDGTRNGTPNGVTFEFDWTPPATNVGNIIFYAAGNAANGNGSPTGDHIYTTSVQISPAPGGSAKPSIRSEGGVVNGASFQPGIAPNSWFTITGSNLAVNTRTWGADDLKGGKLPTSLDGTSITVNGKPAFVEFISPTQINAMAPADSAAGPVQVQVTTNGQASDPVVANIQSFAPACFLVDGKYLAATHANNSPLGKKGLFPASPNATTPAAPGETIVLYATGLGPTDPAIPSGQLTDKVANLTTPLTVMIGGTPATVSFAGLIPGFAGLYQINVQVPATAADGDQKIALQIGGASSPSSDSCCFVTVQK